MLKSLGGLRSSLVLQTGYHNGDRQIPANITNHISPRKRPIQDVDRKDDAANYKMSAKRNTLLLSLEFIFVNNLQNDNEN